MTEKFLYRFARTHESVFLSFRIDIILMIDPLIRIDTIPMNPLIAKNRKNAIKKIVNCKKSRKVK